MGKNCEVKASEPKTAEAAQYAHSTINLPPPHHHQAPAPQGWANQQVTQQRMVINGGGSGAPVHPLQVPQTMPFPSTLNYGSPATGGAEARGAGSPSAGGGVPIYSHSTITRTTAGPVVSADGSAHEGAANVYIQNNFYTLPPGSELPPSHTLNTSGPTPEALQAKQTEQLQKGGTMTLEQTVTAATSQAVAAAAAPPQQYAATTYAPAPSALQPMYPGATGGEHEHTGSHVQHQQQQQQQHIQTMIHPHYQ